MVSLSLFEKAFGDSNGDDDDDDGGDDDVSFVLEALLASMLALTLFLAFPLLAILVLEPKAEDCDDIDVDVDVDEVELPWPRPWLFRNLGIVYCVVLCCYVVYLYNTRYPAYVTGSAELYVVLPVQYVDERDSDVRCSVWMVD